MKVSSRGRAKDWPYPKYNAYVRTLQQAAAAWYKEKGLATHSKRPYSLPSLEHWPENIILKEVADYIQKTLEECQQASKPFPLHKYMHHGLSSQALAFNLIGPLIIRQDFSPIALTLEKSNISNTHKICSASFEYEDRAVFNEDTGQPTSIDVVLRNEHGKPFIFIECKLREERYGGCSVFETGDCDGNHLFMI